MQYTSTRNNAVSVSCARVITEGLSPDGGLYIPTEIPEISLQDIMRLADKSYIERAKTVLSLFLTDFTAQEIDACVEGAYKKDKFDSIAIAPVVRLTDNEYILELF